MKYKKILFLLPFLSFTALSVYAVNTLIQQVPGSQQATGLNSYLTQQIRTVSDGDLRFMNLNSDTILTGDYFSGYYYDSAYGMFQTDSSASSGVRISSTTTSLCPVATYDGYKLEGYSYNPLFGFTDFNYDTSRYVYICIPKTAGQLGNTLTSYLGGYSYSPLIGFQNFAGIYLNTSVVKGTESLTQSARQIKIIGLASSQIVAEAANGQFLQDVRLLGKTSKPELRKRIQENVATAKKGMGTVVTSGTITDLSGTVWGINTPGTNLNNGKVRYFSPTGGNISLSGINLSGNKTLVVEGGNVYITGNIIGTGILGVIALEKNGQGGNIYIDPSVTDIHAVLYADRSAISYNGTTELDGSTLESDLANQLYIKGSLFSENTLGGSILAPVKCPYYVIPAQCNTSQKAAKYDLNYLRRYVMVQPVDVLGVPSGPKVVQFGASQSLQTATRLELLEYPVIIEYDSRVQQTPPTLLQ